MTYSKYHDSNQLLSLFGQEANSYHVATELMALTEIENAKC